VPNQWPIHAERMAAGIMFELPTFFSPVDNLDNQVYCKQRTGRGTSFR